MAGGTMAPDPYYHTPGYGGFCPQFKYQIGQTFGRTTAQLLESSGVVSSGRVVLADTRPQQTREEEAHQARVRVVRARTHSWGDQKLQDNMMPGYTGFIPKSQHYFGKRYTINCTNAISDHETADRAQQQKAAALRSITARQTPLLPIISSAMKHDTKDSMAFISKSMPHYYKRSPYSMNNTDPDKKYLSGYTGFVPRSRGLLGQGYPLITHRALNAFTDDMSGVRKSPLSRHGNKAVIYPAESGIVPNYTGHIPGRKFEYGSTFGHSTKNVLQQNTKAAISIST